jgi:hypothetical protein
MQQVVQQKLKALAQSIGAKNANYQSESMGAYKYLRPLIIKT